MKRRSVAGGVVLVWFVGAVLAAPVADEAMDEKGVPGMRAVRIEESVFDGRAMVYETGTHHERSVLLVHGIGDSGARDYLKQIPWLAQNFHVIAVDLPGFGQSDKRNALYSPRNYVAFLKHVADRFAHRSFILIGHSMGGVVALRYAATYPDDLERLVVVDAAGILHRYAYASYQLDQFGTGTSFLPAPVNPARGIAGIVRKIMGHAETRNLVPATVLQTATTRQRYLGGDPIRIAALAMAADDLSQDVQQIATETLLVWGRKDTLAPLRTGKLLAQVLPHARLSVIDDAGHEPMIQTPEALRAIVEPFLLQGLEASPAPPAVTLPKHGVVTCRQKRQLVYEGEYDTLMLTNCHDILIRNARVRALIMEDSSARIEDSQVGGGEVGMKLRSTIVEMTGGRIDGDVAIVATASRLDLAGVTVEAKQAVVQAPASSEIVFSMSQVRSPKLNGTAHAFYALEDGGAL